MYSKIVSSSVGPLSPFEISYITKITSSDNGVDYIYLDNRLVTNYYADVDGATNKTASNLWAFPCVVKRPDLVFKLGLDGVATFRCLQMAYDTVPNPPDCTL